MIGHNSPRIASRLRFLNQITQPIDKVLSVGVILENRIESRILDRFNDVSLIIYIIRSNPAGLFFLFNLD
jgi:hypothetical protein